MLRDLLNKFHKSNSENKYIDSYISEKAFIERDVNIVNSTIDENARVEKNSWIAKSHIHKYSKIGWDSYLYSAEIFDYSYSSIRVSISNTKVGKFCSIGQDTLIAGGIHPTDYISTNPVFIQKNNPQRFIFTESENFINYKQTVIGNDVWLGARCIIMDGVKIGDGAIIGAGSVVIRDVEPYAIYAGTPAKLLKYRFDKEIIELLLSSAWWNVDILKLKKINSLFDKPLANSSQVKDFIDKLNSL